MFAAGKTTPKIGEIRLGYVTEPSSTHKYVGVHPYLVVSNNVYNQTSGQTEVIPFTTKRMNSSNPVHVDFPVGEVDGLYQDSTLVVENRDTLLNTQLSDPIGSFNDDNWRRAANAMVIQCPFLRFAFDGYKKARTIA